MMNETKTRRFAADWDVAAYAAAALATFGILMLYAGKKSFNTDELYRLGFYLEKTTLSEILSGCWDVRGANPPLFNFLAWVWFRLAPYGQRWLQMLPALCASLGVFLTGLAGRAFRGKLTGVLAAVFAMASPALLLTGGHQFAQYGTLLLASGLTAFSYFLRTGPGRRSGWGAVVFYGLSMATMPYTHYVAVLVPMTLFLFDVVLYVKKQLPLRAFASYLIGGGLFLPWGLAILKTTGERTEFWITKPRLLDIPDTFRYLTDENGVLLLLFVLGCCLSLVVFLSAIRKRTLDRDSLLPLLSAAVPFVSVLLLFFYSAFVRPDVPLYLDRYFLGCLPFLALTEAYAAERALSCIPAPQWKTGAAAGCLALFILLGFRSEALVRADVSTPNETYREAADCLAEEPDIRDPGTAAVTSNLSAYVTAGWMQYYVVRGDARAPFTVFDYETPFTEADVARYETVYAFTEHAQLPEETQRLLAAYYAPDASYEDGRDCGVLRYLRADAR